MKLHTSQSYARFSISPPWGGSRVPLTFARMCQRVWITVSNDLVTDQRVAKQCESLQRAGMRPHLIGRILPTSLPLTRAYPTRRIRLLFNRGPLFYAELNFRFALLLLFSKASILLANDLDTLPAACLVSFLRNIPLVYDSHEFFTGVPEIQRKPVVRGIWKRLEKLCIHRASLILTVNASIAHLLKHTYRLEAMPVVVRNLPLQQPLLPSVNREQLLAGGYFILMVQGSGINVDRGVEELLEALTELHECGLVILGSGDALPALKAQCQHLQLTNRVRFIPKMPYEEMMRYTQAADLGLSLDKGSNVNYQFSLPNKVFDYVKAGIPIMASDLKEVRQFVMGHGLGYICPDVSPESIRTTLKSIMADQAGLEQRRLQCQRLSHQLSWESEFTPVLDAMKRLGTN